MKCRILIRLTFNAKFFIVKVPNPGTKCKTQQMHQSKNMIGETRCICVMFPDIQVAFVVQQSITRLIMQV
ncbi:Uncharacterised protein [Klebsiella pneumoniae]|nr:Uncharacterised protein [Klebsiella pneumoniae]